MSQIGNVELTFHYFPLLFCSKVLREPGNIVFLIFQKMIKIWYTEKQNSLHVTSEKLA